MNPYEVLGVREDASDEEIKKAYHKLVKQYHPDQYADGPMAKLAEEKIREVNVAYDEIQKMRTSGRNSTQYQGARSDADASGSDFSRYQACVDDLQNGRYEQAAARLDEVPPSDRDAAWYYLSGELARRRGWYDTAYQYFSQAVRMEPGNVFYRRALENLYGGAAFYRGSAQSRGYSRSGDDLCRVCETLYCADCCCEMMGGDLIRCC